MKEKETTRVEAFSDGAFAIAITLLILEIKVPHLGAESSDRGLLVALSQLWPSFLAFGGSFTAILIMWVNHHGLFRMLRGVDSLFLYTNGFLLLMITFIPFPTVVLAEYLDKKGANTAAALYCATMVVINIAYSVLHYAAASNRRLIAREVPQAHLFRIKWAYGTAFPIYLAATRLSLWHASVGLAICMSLWIFWARLNYNPKGESISA
ncbi:MAG: DUF1211 domain-containing protein [Bryobacteraceae bacterium]|nr:DUF1211 domain-containing protein [Bryobacteraceae bacterium]